MRVLFIHNVSVWGGSLRSLYETIRTLATHPSVGEIHLILPESSHVERFEEYATVHLMKAVPQYDSTEYGKYTGFRKLILLREIYARFLFKKGFKTFLGKQLEFDIIHFNEIVSFNAISSQVKRSFSKAKVVCHVRSLQKSGKQPKFVMKQLVNNADALITIDDCVKRTLPSAVRNKAFIVPNIFDDHKAVPRHTTERENKSLRVLYIGGLGWEKGPDYALECARITKEKGLNCTFTFAGIKSETQSVPGRIIDTALNLLKIRKTFKKADIETYVIRHSLEKHVELKGFVVDIGELFVNHDVLIFPSRLNAPGRPSIEAMSHGLPSIIFCNFGSNLVVKEGETGFNVPNEDVACLVEKIEVLLANPEMLVEMKKESLKHFGALFTPLIHKGKVLEVYKKILN